MLVHLQSLGQRGFGGRPTRRSRKPELLEAFGRQRSSNRVAKELLWVG